MLLLFAFPGTTTSKENAINSTLPIEAGDCLIVDSDKNILMIVEAISGRYSIPGGSSIGEETGEEAAKRETYEETGLHVNVGKQIARTYNSAIFACELVSPTPYFIDSQGRKVLMAWSAPHFGKEVMRVLMMPDNETVRDNYRFPEHKWMFKLWVPEVTPSAFVLSAGDTAVLTPFYQAQLSLLQSLYEWKAKSTSVEVFVTGTIALGSLFTPFLFLVSLIYIRAYHGHRATLIYGAGLLSISTFVLILTTVVELPRPYFIDPVFGEQDTLGYTLPSAMVSLTTFFFSWLLLNWDKESFPKGRKRLALFAAFCVSVISGKVLLQGEHYPSDIVLGLLIGFGFSVGFKRLRDWRFANRNRALTSARFWLMSFVVAATIGIGIHKPHIVYLSAFSLGIYCALLWLKVFPLYVSAVRRPSKLTFFMIALVGVIVIVFVDNAISSRYAVNTVIVAVNCALAWAISVWLLLVTPRIIYQFVR
ncbi:phosphatase PAP2 family protein [Grimontia sp. NTOU-MAR1]|uniref:phosphatase PAP2 family protein n=1 Tax=Grimontia sp. NTOU-MAR1 TaxID=3111011 RepID=UPI002DB7F9EC|nr:phosphatase PAP2 family protein [Grimontia sp. NTOU-MAR1]WRV97947.1 phosphatase PAP2 family protein [Grimontia sp. NTOU-MAR1]